MPPEAYDVVVVGAGPVGLHAALKAAVLNHTVLLVDKGREFSRVVQAPAIANVPGHVGISGRELLELGRAALADFAKASGKDLVTVRERTEVLAARRDGDGFLVRLRTRDGGEEREARSRVLLLATGIVDRKPGIDAFRERGHLTIPFVRRSEVGYCLLCEGWSLEGKRVAVVGCGDEAVEIARDVRDHFGGHVALLTDGEAAPDAARAAGLHVDARPVTGMRDADGALEVTLGGGATARFDKALVHEGWYKVNNELAVMLGAATTRDGYVVTDERGEVVDSDGRVVRGLFAAGDVRAGRWKQIVVGWGDAETAAITAYARRLPD